MFIILGEFIFSRRLPMLFTKFATLAVALLSMPPFLVFLFTSHKSNNLMPLLVLRGSLPQTLSEWRAQGRPIDHNTSSSLWLTPLFSTFFRKQGYRLWKLRNFIQAIPPDETCPIRTFNYVALYGGNITQSFFIDRHIHFPARTIHNQDILIRLASVEGDAWGDQYIQALQRLSMGRSSYEVLNPTLPVLNRLTLDRFHFVVFPLVFTVSRLPWFYDIGEMLDFITQLCQGVQYCHQKRVAHRDIALSNILCNFAGGFVTPTNRPGDPVHRFRSQFPIRYYITDWEWAAVFDENSALSDCTVIGLPEDRTPARYSRPVAREMLSSEPYSPFQTDIFHLGKLFQGYLGGELSSYLVKENGDDALKSIIKKLLSLFDLMTAEDAFDRPTAAVVVSAVQEVVEEARAAGILHLYVGSKPHC
ncbi:hypothetical protein ARMSODRAFT_1078520 [Armillaria solidipes]|uniref:Protein kinase domain-containing protein n=1 Tax=Armillaria solidipes TaxID=1076256 RepID=A0A2H3CDD5_9AGAR|nr:hypothetical protein ARMSODRAFT_1078520 [Armillaria solidipes]